MGKDGRWRYASEESPSCTERGCPVKAGEADGQPDVDSPDWRAVCRVRATETRPVGNHRSEKGNPPRSNLRIGRLQVARRGRKTRAVTKATTWPVLKGTERDDHQEQNSAYSPTLLTMVPIAQSAERLSVEQEVAGSCPARHPNKFREISGDGGYRPLSVFWFQAYGTQATAFR